MVKTTEFPILFCNKTLIRDKHRAVLPLRRYENDSCLFDAGNATYDKQQNIKINVLSKF